MNESSESSVFGEAGDLHLHLYSSWLPEPVTYSPTAPKGTESGSPSGITNQFSHPSSS